jgi:hypothetical protein
LAVPGLSWDKQGDLALLYVFPLQEASLGNILLAVPERKESKWKKQQKNHLKPKHRTDTVSSITFL